MSCSKKWFFIVFLLKICHEIINGQLDDTTISILALNVNWLKLNYWSLIGVILEYFCLVRVLRLIIMNVKEVTFTLLNSLLKKLLLIFLLFDHLWVMLFFHLGYSEEEPSVKGKFYEHVQDATHCCFADKIV